MAKKETKKAAAKKKGKKAPKKEIRLSVDTKLAQSLSLTFKKS